LPWPLLGILFLGFGSATGFVICLIVSLALLLFFRIPPRPPLDLPTGTILAAANGKITAVNLVEAPFLGSGQFHHVVTFLSVFNVHVQRAPNSGTVVSSRFTPGKKVAAFRKDAGDVNENHQIVVRNAAGEQFAIKQIAGLLARRVVCSLSVGDEIERGQLIGLIKFGSRVDLYLPSSYEIEVRPNQTVHEGHTVIARARSKSE
jgi:phosphatidylserine decarboxylase